MGSEMCIRDRLTYEEIVAADLVAQKFQTLNAKIATGLGEIIQGTLKQKIQLIETQMDQNCQMMTGRMMAWQVYNSFKLTAVDGAMLEFKDLLRVKLRPPYDNLQGFKHAWQMTIEGMKEVPKDAYLESLFRDQLALSPSFKDKLELYDHDVDAKLKERSYESLMAMLETHLEVKHFKKNRDDLDHPSNRGPGLSLIHI